MLHHKKRRKQKYCSSTAVTAATRRRCRESLEMLGSQLWLGRMSSFLTCSTQPDRSLSSIRVQVLTSTSFLYFKTAETFLLWEAQPMLTHKVRLTSSQKFSPCSRGSSLTDPAGRLVGPASAAALALRFWAPVDPCWASISARSRCRHTCSLVSISPAGRVNVTCRHPDAGMGHLHMCPQ